jgi:hypothetical protein
VTVERSVATSLDAVIEALASGRAKERRRAFVEDVLSTIPIEPYDLDVARAMRRCWRTLGAVAARVARMTY